MVWLDVLSGAAPLLPGSEDSHGYVVDWFTWIPAGNFAVDVGFVVDALTACLLIVVTTIGLLVHVYSIGYMSHDPGYWRFFAYLNLFMFSMLLLVLASNFLVVFVAWELVGLCSYLLIGFWYRKRSAALAAKKAFIVNRVGDVGFALGIMLIFVSLGTLDIREVIERIGELDPTTITLIALLIFAGAMGKSAQFPLHVWLPDAMEGPTPVSALIHAATMVNAGVYLVARTNPIFAHAPAALVVVAAIGIFTAILAASIAMTQTDIKRVLAYSTLSQLGYMFAALGVGAWTAAIFHLMTHGFFKGLLFLGSGSVIHAVHEEQDMRRMGGLSQKIPITYVTMLIGSLAIAGIPPLAGFFSKDEILGESFKLGFAWVWAIGFIVAGLTAFYMFRLMGLTFWGAFRGPKEIWDKIHESPPVMTIPLILLAIPSVFLGMYLGLPLGASRIQAWLAPGLRGGRGASSRASATEPAYELFGIDGVLILASVTIATIGMVLAWRLFGVGARSDPDAGPPGARPRADGAGPVPLPRVAQQVVVRRPLPPAVHGHRRADRGGHLVVRPRGRRRHRQRASGPATIDAGRGLRQVQTGRVQNYALGHRHRPDRDGRLVPAAGGPLTMDVTSIPILTIIIFLPLVGALAVAIAPATRGAAARARASRSLTWVVSLFLLVGYLPGSAGLPVRRDGRLDPDLRHPVQARRRRAVGRAGRPDHDAVVDLDPGQLQADPDPDQGIHDLVPRPRGRDDRRLPRARHVPVLHLLGDRPRPDVPDHRDLGRRQPDLRDDQVRPVHARRVAADAGGDPGHGLRLPGGPRRLVGRRLRLRGPARLRRHRRLRRRPPARSRSWRSSWPSPSRSRCSRSTPGCPTPTPRRRRRAR